jgi:hypothetical protein
MGGSRVSEFHVLKFLEVFHLCPVGLAFILHGLREPSRKRARYEYMSMSTTCISACCCRPIREACVLISSASIGLVMGVIQITKVN